MSWLARSLTHSLLPDPPSGDGGATPVPSSAAKAQGDALESDGGREEEEGEEEEDPNRGVKDDLSELSQTLARQFWGVASFLAPLPHSSGGDGGRPPESPPHQDGETSSDSAGVAGIRNDFAAISGKFRSGFSKISSNMGVSEISKFASNFLPSGVKEEEEAEEEEEDFDDDYRNFGASATGITDEVMSFVHNISMHPETWLDFPLLSDDEDSDDFYLSNAQIEHAYTVERLSPRLAALRIELCPNHMSEGCFWKTYFVLLHPRLSKHDAELLSTPQVVEARALLLQKLQNQAKAESPRLVDVSHRKLDETSFKHLTTSRDTNFEAPSVSANAGTEKNPVQSMVKAEAIAKKVVEEPTKEPPVELNAVHSNSFEKFDEDEDMWPEDDTEDIVGSGSITFPINSEDVSFSDLEEEDERDAPKAPNSSCTTLYHPDSPRK